MQSRASHCGAHRGASFQLAAVPATFQVAREPACDLPRQARGMSHARKLQACATTFRQRDRMFPKNPSSARGIFGGIFASLAPAASLACRAGT